MPVSTPPGTYTATETGTGTVTVTMTFSDSAITEVKVATTEETTETVDDGTPKWLGTAPVIADSDIVDTFETEVLVVGGGTGGLFAACSAAENGAKNTGYILCTMDGIQIDQNMNAVDTDNDPIPGLYVVGNDSGGYFSGTYPNLSTGAACGRTVTFGRRAGRIAATEGI